MKEIKEDGDVEEKNGNVKDFSIISKWKKSKWMIMMKIVV
jgi:hypothetical protein